MTDKNPFMSSMIVFSSKDIREKSEDELKAEALAQLREQFTKKLTTESDSATIFTSLKDDN